MAIADSFSGLNSALAREQEFAQTNSANGFRQLLGIALGLKAEGERKRENAANRASNESYFASQLGLQKDAAKEQTRQFDAATKSAETITREQLGIRTSAVADAKAERDRIEHLNEQRSELKNIVGGIRDGLYTNKKELAVAVKRLDPEFSAQANEALAVQQNFIKKAIDAGPKFHADSLTEEFSREAPEVDRQAQFKRFFKNRVEPDRVRSQMVTPDYDSLTFKPVIGAKFQSDTDAMEEIFGKPARTDAATGLPWGQLSGQPSAVQAPVAAPVLPLGQLSGQPSGVVLPQPAAAPPGWLDKLAGLFPFSRAGGAGPPVAAPLPVAGPVVAPTAVFAPPLTIAPTVPTGPGMIPPPTQRIVGQAYMTPRGPMIWLGNGWQPAP